jgi:hypothetical protein
VRLAGRKLKAQEHCTMTFLTTAIFTLVFQLPIANLHGGVLSTASPASSGSLRMAAAGGQSSDHGNNGTKELRGSQKHAKAEAPIQTFTGIVEWEYKPLAWDCQVPNCDHFALYDDSAKTNYELDDARKALPFEGKRAKVTGVVNIKDSIIHVMSIEALN